MTERFHHRNSASETPDPTPQWVADFCLLERPEPTHSSSSDGSATICGSFTVLAMKDKQAMALCCLDWLHSSRHKLSVHIFYSLGFELQQCLKRHSIPKADHDYQIWTGTLRRPNRNTNVGNKSFHGALKIHFLFKTSL